MPALGPIKRRELIGHLRTLGFSGPYPGARHEFMTKGKLHLILPNPHGDEISLGFLRRILRQARITRDEWEAL
jgi:predicted RNA binding protein YcfA (HicA-like mRNA interferase family)